MSAHVLKNILKRPTLFLLITLFMQNSMDFFILNFADLKLVSTTVINWYLQLT